MTDTAFEVRYMRRHQIGQYEPQEAEIKATFNDDLGDITTAEDGLRQCREAVERVLGLRADGSLRAQPAATAPVVSGEAAKAEDTPSEPAKRRGRPTKEEAAAKLALEAKARLAADEALKNANADPMADIVGEQPNISTGEERSEPVADPMDDMGIPDVPAAEEERPITDQELQNEAARAVQRLGDANLIRKMVKTNYRVERLGEIPPNHRKAVVNDLRNLQKDGSIKAPEKK